MKRVPTIAASLLLAASWPAGAAAPGDAALGFLGRLQRGDAAVEALMKDTALSPYCGAQRRKAIEWQLGGFLRNLRSAPREYAVLEEKQDGEFAAVLVSMLNASDPLDVGVLALGLAKDGEKWKPAPMPGSFDNVRLAFNDELQSRVDALEVWMGSERVRHLRALHGDAERAFRDRMAKAVPDALLENANPRQHVEAFLEASREGNLPAAMRLLGDFEDGFSEEDRKLQQTIARGLRGEDQRAHWRLLTSPNIVQVIVQEDEGDDLDADVVMLIFDPVAADPTTLLRFVLLRVGKRWEIQLPVSLRLADETRMEFQRAIWRQDNSEDDALRNRFEELFEKEHGPLRAQDLPEAGKKIEKTLREGSLEDFFRYLHRGKDLSESERRSAYRYMASFWSKFHQEGKAASEGELIEVLEEGQSGLVAFHLISTAQLERVDLLTLVMLREEDGWAVAPGVTTAGNYKDLPKERADEQNRVLAAFNEQKDALSKKAAARFLERFVKAVPAEGGKVNPEEASELIKTFRQRLRDGKLLAAFECCALLDAEEGAWEALKSLSYEHKGARKARLPDRELKVASEKHWGAVSLRIDPGDDSVPIYPMYLVVSTGTGPRIVVDIGLRLATNKGREVLNGRVWKRIEEQLDDAETALVRSLFQGHVEGSKRDLAEWEKNNK